MPKEPRTAKQLAAIIREKLAMPGAQIDVSPDANLGWSVTVDFRAGAPAETAIRLEQLVQELRELYGLKTASPTGPDTIVGGSRS